MIFKIGTTDATAVDLVPYLAPDGANATSESVQGPNEGTSIAGTTIDDHIRWRSGVTVKTRKITASEADALEAILRTRPFRAYMSSYGWFDAKVSNIQRTAVSAAGQTDYVVLAFTIEGW